MALRHVCFGSPLLGTLAQAVQPGQEDKINPDDSQAVDTSDTHVTGSSLSIDGERFGAW